MREIKFRVWSKITNEYINNSDNPHNADYRDDWYVVEQFTGLKDKNGKDIYEGDKIGMEDHWYEGDGKYFGFIGEVEFEDGCFAVIGDGDIDYIELNECSIVNREFEVIGNIHETKPHE